MLGLLGISENSLDFFPFLVDLDSFLGGDQAVVTIVILQVGRTVVVIVEGFLVLGCAFEWAEMRDSFFHKVTVYWFVYNRILDLL